MATRIYLIMHQDLHVHEHLVQLRDGRLQLLYVVVPGLDVCQRPPIQPRLLQHCERGTAAEIQSIFQLIILVIKITKKDR